MNLPAATLVKGDALATALFRIVQEALTNVARHAQASDVTIELVEEDAQLVLSIKDNGEGMGEAPRKEGIGLVSMRERASSVGGSFSFTRIPGEGATVKVCIPMRRLGDKKGEA